MRGSLCVPESRRGYIPQINGVSLPDFSNNYQRLEPRSVGVSFTHLNLFGQLLAYVEEKTFRYNMG